MKNIDNRNKKPTTDPEVVAVVEDKTEVIETPELENVPPDDIIPEPTITSDEPEVPTAPEVPEVSEDDNAPKVEIKKPELPETPEVDYKERYKESQKEALNLHLKTQKLTEAIDDAAAIPEPTEDEMRAYADSKGTDYDYLDEFNKDLLKKTLLSEKRFQKIQDVNKETKNIQDWISKVKRFVESTEVVAKYPDLVDNADDFVAFATKQSRRGSDLDDLTTSFMYGLTLSPTPKKNKGSMLMPGGNGAAAEPKPEGLTPEDAANIRVNNPKKYKELIKSGKLKLQL